MKLSIQAGATSQSINVFISDSSSTTGAGLTGLVYNTSSLVAYYSFTGANATATAITLATLSTVTSAYSSGGFKEIDATNMPGWYRLDLPNAVLATSKGRVVSLLLKGAANMAPCPVEIELTGWDNQSATPDVNVAKWNSSTVSPFYVRQGTAQAGNTATITLDSGASSTNNFYNNMTIFLTGGTGAGQTARISDYVGSTKVATIGHNWVTQPDNTTTFAIMPVRWGGNVDNVIGVVGGVTGSVTITGPGVWAYDHTGVAVAPASTALSSATWTGTKAGYLDAAISGRMATFTLPTNFSSLAIDGSGRITVGTNADKTGYSLTQAFPTNFSSLAITGGGAVTAGTVSDKTGYAVSSLANNVITTASINDGAITDAKITVPTPASGLATGILGMVQQVWRRAFKKTTFDSSTGLLKTYANDGTTVYTTETCTEASNVQTKGAAS